MQRYRLVLPIPLQGQRAARGALRLGRIIVPAAGVDEESVECAQARERHGDVLAHILIGSTDQCALLGFDEPAVEALEVRTIGGQNLGGQRVRRRNAG
jgi:hypothetical protein